MATILQLRRGLASDWTSNNPILASGEAGVETDTNKFKFGDGITSWTSLPYVGSGSGSDYELPTASTTILGGVKVDGSSITILDGVISSSGSGTTDYDNLTDKPSINSITLSGNKTSTDLGLQPSGSYLTSESDPIFAASQANNITSEHISVLNNTSGINTGDETKQTIENKLGSFAYDGRQIVIVNPYKTKQHSYKGQIHCHTSETDGIDTPLALVTAYKSAGYDFVSITDHNIIVPSPNVSDILFIEGTEATFQQGHFTAVGVTSIPETLTGEVSALDPQEYLKVFSKQGAFVTMAHPSYDYNADTPWSSYELLGLDNFNAIEMCNAGVSTDESVNIDAYMAKNLKANYVASDDCHNITNPALGNFNAGWIVVSSDTLTKEAILHALKTGNYYSSQGADLEISIENNVVTATTSANATIKFIGCKDDNIGSILKSTDAVLTSSYTIIGNEKYIRVEVIKTSDSKKAWSNPIYVEAVERNTTKNSPEVTYSQGAPVIIPSKIGDIFVNRTLSLVYIAIGNTSVNDWVPISNKNISFDISTEAEFNSALSLISNYVFGMVTFNLMNDLMLTSNGKSIVDLPISRLTINGNSHTLSIPNATGNSALYTNAHLILKNISIVATKATYGVVHCAMSGIIRLQGTINITGNTSTKSAYLLMSRNYGNIVGEGDLNLTTNGGLYGVYAGDMSKINLYYTSTFAVKNCTNGVYATNQSNINTTYAPSFTSVATEFSPAKNTLASSNSFIASP